MKSTLLLATLALCNVANAAEPPAWHGDADCKVAAITPQPKNDAVKWAGPCKDGYAEGQGVLTWSAPGKGDLKLEATLVRGQVSGEATMSGKFGSYIGTFKHGQPHGQGFFRFADGKLYEGDVVNGKPEGTGTGLDLDRSRYDGQWKDGKRNGHGKQVYTLGGSYEGEWKDDKFDGKGVIVYVGSGRRYEGLFREGRVDGLAKAATEEGRYFLQSGYHKTGTRIADPDAIGYGPLNATWEQLTPGQQNLVKSFYAALEEGDEPPYPLYGTGKLYSDLIKVRDAVASRLTGDLLMHILVGKDGKPRSISSYGTLDPQFVKYAASVMMLQQFKPAVCHGEPCEMIYPAKFAFTID